MPLFTSGGLDLGLGLVSRGGDLGGTGGDGPLRKLSWGDRGAYIPPNIFVNVIINCSSIKVC